MIQLHFEFMVGAHNTNPRVSNAMKIAKGQLALLETLFAKSDHTCTLDDATRDLLELFNDGGKWRGSITLELYRDGVISPCGADNSRRPSRNGGLLHVWTIANIGKARRWIAWLRRWIEAKENPQTAATVGGQVKSKSKAPKRKDSGNATI